MRTIKSSVYVVCALVVFPNELLRAEVPHIINYQGRLATRGRQFDGQSDFKFSLVNSNGTATFWSNDGSGAGGSEPVGGVPIAVNNGTFSVNLGDTSLPNMIAISPAVFTNSDVRLRVWFSDRSGNFQQLTPDQRITSVGYAMVAAVAESVADGAITSAKLRAGAVGAAQLAPGAAFSNLVASGQSGVASGGIVLALEPDSSSLHNAGYVNIGLLPLSTDRWETRSTGPSKRWWHTAVWTDTEMIVWGGGAGIFLNDGGRYNPATESWQPVSLVNAPSGRWYHRAVWTGREMIIWGGRSSFFASGGHRVDGGRYNPVSDSWSAVSTEGAPSPRSEFAMVWTGSEMLVWGGLGDGAQNLRTGGRYDPVTDKWMPMTTNGAPEGRFNMGAVWTGEELIIWGGGDLAAADRLGQTFGNGARYRPSTDTWTAISTNGAPPPAATPNIVWSTREMLVWGGHYFPTDTTVNAGGRYNPTSDTWSPISPTGAARRDATASAVWTGREMVIWGGVSYSPSQIWNDGARYNPATDKWTPLGAQNGPSARLAHTAVWTGESMLIFGGYNNLGGAGELNSNHSWRPGSVMYLYQRQ